MLFRFVLFGFVALAAALAAKAEASPAIELGTPVLEGKGCRNGTASVSSSPDGTYLTLLFDQFTVEAGGKSKKPFGTALCKIRVPMKLPDGMRLAVYQIDLRGFASLPKLATASVTTRHELPGFNRQGQPLAIEKGDNFRGPYDGEIFSSIPLDKKNKTKCGGTEVLKADLTLRVNASVEMNRRVFPLPDAAFAAIDSADIGPRQTNVTYHMALEPCSVR